MKRHVILITLFLCSTLVAGVAPASAETNFVERFLSRYRPSAIVLPAAPSAQPGQDLGNLIRGGQLPLTMSDVVNLMLQNNLDVGVNRLSPVSSEYLIETLYRPFEPTLRLQSTVTRNTTPSTSQLTGAPSLSTLGGAYTSRTSPNDS